MSFSFARKAFFGAFFAAACTLAASADTINVSLVNAGNPTNLTSNVTVDGVTKNVYVGAYTLSLNGQDTAAMCIDFGIDTKINDTWTANATTVGSSNLSNTYEPNEGAIYEEEAYLFSQLVQPDADRVAIQTAAWDITAYNIDNPFSGFLYDLFNGDNSYIDAAISHASSMSGSYEIISDTTKGGEQEFIVDPTSTAVTPEPSSLVLTLAPAMLLGMEALRRRKLNAAASL